MKALFNGLRILQPAAFTFSFLITLLCRLSVYWFIYLSPPFRQCIPSAVFYKPFDSPAQLPNIKEIVFYFCSHEFWWHCEGSWGHGHYHGWCSAVAEWLWSAVDNVVSRALFMVKVALALWPPNMHIICITWKHTMQTAIHSLLKLQLWGYFIPQLLQW